MKKLLLSVVLSACVLPMFGMELDDEDANNNGHKNSQIVQSIAPKTIDWNGLDQLQAIALLPKDMQKLILGDSVDLLLNPEELMRFSSSDILNNSRKTITLASDGSAIVIAYRPPYGLGLTKYMIQKVINRDESVQDELLPMPSSQIMRVRGITEQASSRLMAHKKTFSIFYKKHLKEEEMTDGFFYTSNIFDVAISKDSSCIAMTGIYGVTVWNLKLGKKICSILDSAMRYGLLAISSDNKFLVVCFDRMVCICDIASAKKVWEKKIETGINCCALSSDDKLLVLGCQFRPIICILDLNTGGGQYILINEMNSTPIVEVALTADNACAITRDDNGNAFLCELSTQKQTAIKQPIFALTPDALFMASYTTSIFKVMGTYYDIMVEHGTIVKQLQPVNEEKSTYSILRHYFLHKLKQAHMNKKYLVVDPKGLKDNKNRGGFLWRIYQHCFTCEAQKELEPYIVHKGEDDEPLAPLKIWEMEARCKQFCSIQ